MNFVLANDVTQIRYINRQNQQTSEPVLTGGDKLTSGGVDW